MCVSTLHTSNTYTYTKHTRLSAALTFMLHSHSLSLSPAQPPVKKGSAGSTGLLHPVCVYTHEFVFSFFENNQK